MSITYSIEVMNGISLVPLTRDTIRTIRRVALLRGCYSFAWSQSNPACALLCDLEYQEEGESETFLGVYLAPLQGDSKSSFLQLDDFFDEATRTKTGCFIWPAGLREPSVCEDLLNHEFVTAETGNSASELWLPVKEDTAEWSFAASPGAPLVAVGRCDSWESWNPVEFWDTKTKQKLHIIKNEKPVSAATPKYNIAFNANGSLLYFVNGLESTIEIWGIAEGASDDSMQSGGAHMLNAKLLQFPISTAQYRRLMWGDKSFTCLDDPEYWQIVPCYVVARCPICSADYTEQLDTYTLRNWVYPESGGSFFIDQGVRRCEHFLIAHHFINLNGLEPVISSLELRGRKQLRAEKPHVMPMLLTGEGECRAVMHSLPICRIEGNEFVPRYSVYMISYYAPPQFHKRLLDRLRRHNADRHGMGLITWPFENDNAETWYDLQSWVDKERLSWLEPDNPELPLITGPAEKFPYGDIVGRTKPYSVTVPPIVIKTPKIIKWLEAFWNRSSSPKKK